MCNDRQSVEHRFALTHGPRVLDEYAAVAVTVDTRLQMHLAGQGGCTMLSDTLLRNRLGCSG